MSKDRIKELARKYLDGTASQDEINELHQWYDNWNEDAELIVLKADESEDEVRKRILGAVKDKIEFDPGVFQSRRAALRRRYFVAAAAILILFTVSAICFGRDRTVSPEYVSRVIPKNDDVAPPQNARATIVLADGRRVVLDGHSDGVLAKQ